MARRPRQDLPGSWHHVINRGLAKRPLFEDRADIRFFLSRLAREVRRGRIELHCWCVLTTHFHLLVRSLSGELSEALRRSQNEYSRFFNRRHKRDGALVRGRFFSKPVTSLTYRRTLVRYIDRNAVGAGLARSPWEYPWCSAAQYVSGRGPRWLERSWIETEVAEARGRRFSGELYVRVFGGPFSRGAQRLIESRTRSVSPAADDLDELVAGQPRHVLAWMRRKAMLADGSRVGLPVCDTNSLLESVRRARMNRPSWILNPDRRGRSAWRLIEVGLLRTMCGLTWQEIGVATGASLSACHRSFPQHRRLIEVDPNYAEAATRIGVCALRACLSSSAPGETG